MLVILNLPLIGMWIKLLSVPYRLLYPSILVFMAMFVYNVAFIQLNNPADADAMAQRIERGERAGEAHAVVQHAP